MVQDHLFEDNTLESLVSRACSIDIVQRFWQEVNELEYSSVAVVNGEVIGGKCGLHGGLNSLYVALLRYFLDYLGNEGTFLDLGSGSGTPLIYAAHHGFDAYGIDMCPRTIEVATKNVARALQEGFVSDGTIRLAQGNFFPQGFVPKRHDDKDVDPFGSCILDHYHPCGDPYAALGLSLEDVDVFFHYQVERRPNILGFFAQYARVGARLMFVPSYLSPLEETIPRGVHLEAVSDTNIEFYRKVA